MATCVSKLCQLTRVLPWQHHGNQATVDLGGGESYAVDGRFSVSLWFTKGWCNSTSPMTEGVLFDHVQANATSGEHAPVKPPRTS